MKLKQYRLTISMGSGDDGQERVNRWQAAALALKKTVTAFVRDAVDAIVEPDKTEAAKAEPKHESTNDNP